MDFAPPFATLDALLLLLASPTQPTACSRQKDTIQCACQARKMMHEHHPASDGTAGTVVGF